MFDYYRKYFDPVPQPPSIEGKSLPDFDRSNKISPDELEEARVGTSLKNLGGWREPVKSPIWDHGNGPYPCISHYPSFKMILENVNRYDFAALIAPSIVAYGLVFFQYDCMYNDYLFIYAVGFDWNMSY